MCMSDGTRVGVVRNRVPRRAVGATRSKTQEGFSTIEILIAFSVGILFLSSAMMVAFSGGTLTQHIALDSSHAIAYDVALDSDGLNRATDALAHHTASLAHTWHAPLIPSSETLGSVVYDTTPSIRDVSPCVKELTAHLSWSSLQSRDHHITFGTALSNIDVAKALGPSGCDPLPAGTWDSPEKMVSGMSLSNTTVRDIVVIREAGKRIAILGATASTSLQDDVYLYDVSDPTHSITLLGSLDTGNGILAVAYNRPYLFALQGTSTNQLQVIRLFDTTRAPTDPQYVVPKVVQQVTLKNVAGAYPEGRSIAYYDGYVYVGTWNNNFPVYSPEFLIYDVSDPENPVHAGAYNLSHSVNSIMVQESYAYLATTDNSGELTIMDVSHPASPTIKGTFDIPGSTADAEDVYVLGGKTYLGLSRNSGKSELLVIESSTPENPVLLGGINLGLKSSTKVTGIEVRGKYAFVGANMSPGEFRVLDISDPTQIRTEACSPYGLGAKVQDLQYADGYLFIANQGDTGFHILYDTPGNMCN